MADLPPYRTPRWVKIVVIIALVLVLLVVVVLVTGIGGEHGPRRHAPSGDAGSDTPPIEQEVQLNGPVDYTPPSMITKHGVKQL